MLRLCWLLSFLIFCSLIASSQIKISGVVQDSASAAPLPYASIQVSEKVVAITSEAGMFELVCKAGDTIVFNRLGYQTLALIKLKSEEEVIVIMSSSTTLLKSITVFGDYKPHGKARWREYIILPKPFQNPNAKDSMGMIQTFGMGIKIPGPISYFSRYERNRRTYKKVLKDQAATETYREVLTSDVVKQDLLQLFSISESEYFRKIETFNIKHPDATLKKEMRL